MIRILVRQPGHALLFDQMACARERHHQPQRLSSASAEPSARLNED
jgi:hypothetical protein